ncbi:hypothetical protein GWE18_09105 [Bradyrhizobium sp. CSA112]|uniref:glycosyltransferase family protein n=1 Tax=Bradyrhizobium sp. CSA112 TaxID=2699170 RepID=UPI0023AF2338|nr:glycosyltransferase [Bradyrhizobium sp. CSA112]MDE5453017.1 hypothetical protein [Bradyrhizobium sp. CSA112]
MVRILLLPSPFQYVNPTWEKLLGQLVEDGSAIVVGPRTGKASRSLKQIIRNSGPFDVVICDPWFFFQSPSIPEEYLPLDMGEVDIPIIVSLMQYDLHNLSKEFLDRIEAKAACAISACAGHDFKYVPSEDAFRNEPWLERSAHSISSVTALGEKFFLIPHCIGSDEFESSARRKAFDLIVPGVGYHFRRLVREWAAEKTCLTVGNDRDLIQKVLGRLSHLFLFGSKLSWANQPVGIKLYQRRFRTAISRARVAVTCDGSISYPIRKFFEIPAVGTILAAKFFDRPERLGFLAGQNCFSLTEDNLDELADIVELAQSDSGPALRVREAGQTMVRDLHSVSVRARQLRDLCGAVASGDANAMIWKDGRPILIKRVVEH